MILIVLVFSLILIKLVSRLYGNALFFISPIILYIWIGVLLLVFISQQETGALSSDVELIILGGCFSFILGEVLFFLLAKHISFELFNFFKLTDVRVNAVFTSIFLTLIIIIFTFVIKEGADAGQLNWYIGVRYIINYTEFDIWFRLFGYVYLFLYPLAYLAYFKIAKSRLAGISNGNLMQYTVLLISFVYAVLSTAKVKMFLLIFPLISINAFMHGVSYKKYLSIMAGLILLFSLSIIVLDKADNNQGFVSGLYINIYNYTAANVQAFNSIYMNEFSPTKCNVVDSNACLINDFFSVGKFQTNVYSFYYDYFERGYLFFSFLIQFLSGFILSLTAFIARKNNDIFSMVVFGVVLFPSVFQFTQSFYDFNILYLIIISMLLVYKFKIRSDS